MCRGLKNKNYVNLTLRSNGTLNYIDYSFLHTLRSSGTFKNLQNQHNLRDLKNELKVLKSSSDF